MFLKFDDHVGPVYLCEKHCTRAKQTGRIDILISQIRMEKREGA